MHGLEVSHLFFSLDIYHSTHYPLHLFYCMGMYTVTLYKITHGGLALHSKEILGTASHIIYMHCIPANQFKRLVYGENQKHDRNILEDAECSLLDGLYK